jgi:hypothetical protein
MPPKPPPPPPPPPPGAKGDAAPPSKEPDAEKPHWTNDKNEKRKANPPRELTKANLANQRSQPWQARMPPAVSHKGNTEVLPLGREGAVCELCGMPGHDADVCADRPPAPRPKLTLDLSAVGAAGAAAAAADAPEAEPSYGDIPDSPSHQFPAASAKEIARQEEKKRAEVARIKKERADAKEAALLKGAFYTLVPIRPRWRGERRSLRTLPGVSLRPPLAFNPRPRRLSTPTDAFQLHPDIRSGVLLKELEAARLADGGGGVDDDDDDDDDAPAYAPPPPMLPPKEDVKEDPITEGLAGFEDAAKRFDWEKDAREKAEAKARRVRHEKLERAVHKAAHLEDLAESFEVMQLKRQVMEKNAKTQHANFNRFRQQNVEFAADPGDDPLAGEHPRIPGVPKFSYGHYPVKDIVSEALTRAVVLEEQQRKDNITAEKFGRELTQTAITTLIDDEGEATRQELIKARSHHTGSHTAASAW